MKAKVAIDTMVLIWSVRDHVAPETRVAGQEIERELAVGLLRKICKSDAQKVISAVSLAELMVPLDPKRRPDFLGVIGNEFMIAPVDMRAAPIAAQLYNEHRPLRGKGPDRIAFKADTLIVASLKAYGVNIFYTHDDQCRKVAESVMRALPIPSVDESATLYDGLEPRKPA